MLHAYFIHHLVHCINTKKLSEMKTFTPNSQKLGYYSHQFVTFNKNKMSVFGITHPQKCIIKTKKCLGCTMHLCIPLHLICDFFYIQYNKTDLDCKIILFSCKYLLMYSVALTISNISCLQCYSLCKVSNIIIH